MCLPAGKPLHSPTATPKDLASLELTVRIKESADEIIHSSS